ncbi:MAG: aminotransferase class III-fold pyridoxal phosphate-dependent enzyme [Myxococcota bacterium]|nr:aminotransferase class III-fold pyridoxal phosphate-dependent enzyme [Myxococcota bacterium]
MTSSKPTVEACLHAAGLDIEYTRAEGDYLYYADEKGDEVEVLDLVGGYGASLFGHNHPRLVHVLRELLDSQRPFNSQGSVRGHAQTLKQTLSELAQVETGLTYSVTLENTGASAVEAALKHAELEFQVRLEETLQKLNETQKMIRVAERQAEIQISDEVRQLFADVLGLEEALSAEELVQASIDRLSELASASPIVIALEGGFHGKSTGALSLTSNPEYRSPWRRLGFSTTFIPAGDMDALNAVVDGARYAYVSLSLNGSVLKSERAEIVNVIAAFAEPVQGEGGVREVGADFLKSLRARATECGFPLVFDEIQSGMGRTGHFFAATHAGVVADYVLLSKALGGGLTKVSALLIDQSRYLSNFSLLHTSTFAGDDYSSAVAVEALEILRENDGALMERCARIGRDFYGELHRFEQRYPRVITDVRGHGLLMAIELTPREDTASLFLRWASEQGLLGYVVAGYLLNEHGIRVAPTLSNPNTLRIQPSAYITHTEIERFCEGFERALCFLQGEDSGSLLGHLVGREAPKASYVRPVRDPKSLDAPKHTRRVAFLAHLLEPGDARGLDRSLKAYSDKECDQLLGRMSPLLEPFLLHRTTVANVTGYEVDLSVIGVPFTSAQVMSAFRAGQGRALRDKVFQGVELARAEGADVIGFGGYTSIATRSCLDVVEDTALITSGNSVTAAAGIQSTMRMVEELGLANRRLGVVGAVGNLGCVIAELMGESMDSVLLVGRSGGERRLERRAKQIRAALGTRCPRIDISTRMYDLRSCGVIMTATNSPVPVIYPEHVSDYPTVICDIAAPGDVSPRVLLERPNTVVLKGGLVSLPNQQNLVIPGMNQPQGYIYGCLAETILLGLDQASVSPSVGLLKPDGILGAIDMVERHGFRFDPWSKLPAIDQLDALIADGTLGSRAA